MISLDELIELKSDLYLETGILHKPTDRQMNRVTAKQLFVVISNHDLGK